MSIAFGFARQSGGAINLESKPGQGTTVTLEISVGAESIVLPQILTKDDMTVLTGNERILVVEDGSAVRTIAIEMLASLGYEIIQATDAANALEQIERGCSVDLVFSDVIMPGGIDGIHMARILRDKFPQYKILLASGYVDSDRLSGVSEFTFLGKPYDQRTLAQNVRQLLDE